METNVRTPTGIFNQPQRLLVPLFQRPYVWNETDQWQPLWNDIERVASRILGNSGTQPQPHFLGAVVIQQIQNAMGDLQTRIVIDGQQRLTTLQIVLDAIHAVYVQRGHANAAARLAFLVENAEAFRRHPEDRFKVWPTNRDRSAFNEVMGSTPPINYSELKHKESKLVQAHKFFVTQTESWLVAESAHDEAQRADALETAVCKLMQLVVIDLQVDENPQEIFETLNARGTPLTSVDLIKNFVFQRLSDSKADVEKVYHDYWSAFETPFWEQEILSGRLKRPRVVVFFNHWLFSQLGDDVASGEVFNAFKRFVVDHPQLDTMAVVQQIHRAAKVYESITLQGQSSEGDLDRTGLFAYRTEAMQTDIVKPLLLALLDPDRADPIPSSIVDSVIADIESWLVRRMIVRVTTKNYNRIVAELIGIVRRSAANDVGRHVREYLQRQRSDSAFWPDDAMVRSALLHLPVYKRFSRSRVRMILEAIEDEYRGYGAARHVLTGVRTPRAMYSIEHLMPQKWETNWPLPAEVDAEQRDELLHTLGNLTLVTHALNSKVSNAAWNVKTVELNRHGVVLLNNRLTEFAQSGWNEGTIEQRTSALIDVVLRIWPVPDGHAIEGIRIDDDMRSRITVADLLRAGVLQSECVLVATSRSHPDARAIVRADGTLLVNDVPYSTPSAAGCAIRGGRATNGWTFWRLADGTNETLDELRARMSEAESADNLSEVATELEHSVTDASSGHSDVQLRFWQGFAQHVEDCGSPFATKAPRSQTWMSIAIGKSDVHIDAVFATNIGTMTNTRPASEQGPEIRVDLYIYDDDSLYQKLLRQRADIDVAYGSPLQYYAAEGVASRRIFDFLKTDIYDEALWPEYYDWLTERIITMRDVMGRYM